MLKLSKWNVLYEKDQEHLSQVKIVQSYGKGDVIYHQGSPHIGIFCIQLGMVGLRKIDKRGNVKLLNLVHPGQTMGMLSFFAGSDYMTNAEALAPTTVCFIPRPVLTEFVANNSELDLEFLKHISRDLGKAHDTIFANTFHSVRVRMLRFLLSLKEGYGSENMLGQMVLEMPMNRQDIADFLSMRPETITRIIKTLTEDGLVTFHGRNAVLLDLEAINREL